MSQERMSNSTSSQVSAVVSEFSQLLESVKDQEEQQLYIYLLNKYPINETLLESNEETPLKLCARMGDGAVGLVSLLMEQRHVDLEDVGNIYYPKSKRRTALHIAAEVGSVGIARILLEHGANVDAKDFNNRTPLHLASQNFQSKMISLLIDFNANRNALDLDEQTPADLCAQPMWDETITQFKRQVFSAVSSPSQSYGYDDDIFDQKPKKRGRRNSGASVASSNSSQKKTRTPRAKKAPQVIVQPMTQMYAQKSYAPQTIGQKNYEVQKYETPQQSYEVQKYEVPQDNYEEFFQMPQNVGQNLNQNLNQNDEYQYWSQFGMSGGDFMGN